MRNGNGSKRTIATTATVRSFIDAHLAIASENEVMGEVQCHCPLDGHEDVVASFSINLGSAYPEKAGYWYCHGCKVGGTLSKLRRLLQGQDIRASGIDARPIPQWRQQWAD